MSYIDKTYILSRADVTDLNKLLSDGEGVIDDNKLDAIIADAVAVVNSRLSKRYKIPITPVKDDLKRLVLDITLYFIYGIVHNHEEMEGLYNRYKIALKTLDDIATGKYNLQEVSVLNDVTDVLIVTKSRTKKYTKDYLDMM